VRKEKRIGERSENLRRQRRRTDENCSDNTAGATTTLLGRGWSREKDKNETCSDNTAVSVEECSDYTAGDVTTLLRTMRRERGISSDNTA
jgi:hypothetical protein